jgi:hypothetical protein
MGTKAKCQVLSIPMPTSEFQIVFDPGSYCGAAAVVRVEADANRSFV